MRKGIVTVMAFLICAYDKGQVVRQEADTNNDRRVDVWVKFENNERVEQLEDQNFRGRSAPVTFLRVARWWDRSK